jgi:hypothetical protein
MVIVSKSIINQLAFVIEAQCVFFEAENGYLCVMRRALRSRSEHFISKSCVRVRITMCLWSVLVITGTSVGRPHELCLTL